MCFEWFSCVSHHGEYYCSSKPSSLNTEAQVEWQSSTLCLWHEELKKSQSKHWPNSHPSLPDKLQRWPPLCISNRSLYLYRRNLLHAFSIESIYRSTVPKAPWPLTLFPSASSFLEGLPLSGLHTIWQTTDKGRMISKKYKCHQNLIGIVCMLLYTQPHTAQILPTRSEKTFLSQH